MKKNQTSNKISASYKLKLSKSYLGNFSSTSACPVQLYIILPPKNFCYSWKNFPFCWYGFHSPFPSSPLLELKMTVKNKRWQLKGQFIKRKCNLTIIKLLEALQSVPAWKLKIMVCFILTSLLPPEDHPWTSGQNDRLSSHLDLPGPVPIIWCWLQVNKKSLKIFSSLH